MTAWLLPFPAARRRALVRRVLALEPELRGTTEADLARRSQALRYRARSGEPLDRLLPEAFALVRESAARHLGLRHFPVQVLGGVVMHSGAIAEMQTGEGKTLTATLPLYLNALSGKGTHLATVNDYLARRDADWMRRVFESLGLSVGCVQSGMPRSDRRRAYACDVTYGTAKEFGFDFLRDRLLLRQNRDTGSDGLAASLLGTAGPGDALLQRERHFVLVDEADSVLIDEARTPLILSAPADRDSRAAGAAFRWSAAAAPRFIEKEHFVCDAARRTVELTAAGRQRARALPKPPEMDSLGQALIYEYLERAIRVARDFERDRQYVIRDGKVVIVDEFTGRLAEGRQWRDGVHQAVEAKEGLEVTVATPHLAQITVQELFRGYEQVVGMTGTAASSARELRKVYRLSVHAIPTHCPSRRARLPERVLGTAELKAAAVVQEVAAMHRTGRPVLIGTRSIDKSDRLSEALSRAGIEHQVLHARHLAEEAGIIAQAGQRGRVTVATNMAGRGTDIMLGEGVAELGGLHVIGTEMHDSARIDRQLAGRCGRQGDPGSFRQFLALDDDVLREGFGPDRAARLAELGRRSDGPFDRLARLFRTAQQRVERRHLADRRALMHYATQRARLHARLGQDPYLDAPA